MYKYKKGILYLITGLFILLTLIELVIYLKTDSNLLGLIYLIINAFIIFLLVPCAYNYKKYYSSARISKLILIIVIGLFCAYILKGIVINNMAYSDSSQLFHDKVKIIKNIIKPILLLILSIFTIFELKGEKIIKTISKKNVD